MTVLCRILLLGALTAACAHGPTLTSIDQVADKRIVIFVPDVFQSSLRTPEGSLRWLPWYRPLFGGGDIGYGNPEMPLVAGEVLTAKPAPFGTGRDVSGHFLEALQRELGDGAALVPFAYDWRAPLGDVAAALAERVESFHAQRFRNVQLVCHGMGGLVCASYLRFSAQKRMAVARDNWRGARRVTRVALLGTPFLGSVAALGHMDEGFQVGVNGSLIGARALVTFPGYLHLLPSPRSDFVVSQLRHDITRTLYGSQNWLSYGWGMFASQPNLASDEDGRSRYALLQAGLAESADFSDKLNAPTGPVSRLGVRILNVVAGGHPTLTRYVWDIGGKRFVKDAREAARLFGGEWRALMIQDGDGAVCAEAQKLPKAFGMVVEAQEKTIASRHGDFLQSPGLAVDVARFLQ